MNQVKIRKKLGAVQIGGMELRLCHSGGSAAHPNERQQRAMEALADVLKVALPHIVGGLQDAGDRTHRASDGVILDPDSGATFPRERKLP